MRPTDKFGTFSRTSGGVEVDADTAEEIVVAAIDEAAEDGVVDGMTGEELAEEVWQYPLGMNERNPNDATSVRKIK